MPVDRPGTTANQLARDYVASLNEFADEVIAVIAKASDSTPDATRALHRREICAALSAAMYSALDASALSGDERNALNPHLKSSLAPFWENFEICDPGEADYIATRSLHYLTRRSRGSQVKTAVTIVETLLDALGVPKEKKSALTRQLTPIFAHRMVSDLYRLNDAVNRIGIDLTVLVTLTTLLGMSATVEPLMRLLRLT